MGFCGPQGGFIVSTGCSHFLYLGYFGCSRSSEAGAVIPLLAVCPLKRFCHDVSLLTTETFP